MREVKTLQELLSIQGNVAVDVWAPWCGPCRRFTPMFEQVSQIMTQTTFVKVNLDEADEISTHFGVKSIPTILYLKDGVEKGRNIGCPESIDVFTDSVKKLETF